MTIRSVLTLMTIAALATGCAGSAPSTPVASGSALPSGSSLVITSPAQGAVVSSSTIAVHGTAPAGARIVHDISFAPDDDTIAGSDGSWELGVDLEEGGNELVFRIGDDESTKITLGVTYRPSTEPSPTPSSDTAQASPVPTLAPTREPTPEPTAEPTPEPTARFATFGDGTFEVGTDIKAGTYRLRDAASFCYWARLKGFSGDLGDIIANENVIDAYAVVTIGAKDVGFESNGCWEWSTDLSRVTSSTSAIQDDGTYIVKTDIAAGTWRSTGGDFCYWARLKGFGGTLSDIIANDNVLGGSTIVAIKSTDKGFITNGCGTWSRS